MATTEQEKVAAQKQRDNRLRANTLDANVHAGIGATHGGMTLVHTSLVKVSSWPDFLTSLVNDEGEQRFTSVKDYGKWVISQHETMHESVRKVFSEWLMANGATLREAGKTLGVTKDTVANDVKALSAAASRLRPSSTPKKRDPKATTFYNHLSNILPAGEEQTTLDDVKNWPVESLPGLIVENDRVGAALKARYHAAKVDAQVKAALADHEAKVRADIERGMSAPEVVPASSFAPVNGSNPRTGSTA